MKILLLSMALFTGASMFGAASSRNDKFIVPGNLRASIESGLKWILTESRLPEDQKGNLKNALFLASQNKVSEAQTIIDQVIKALENNPIYIMQRVQIKNTRDGLIFPGFQGPESTTGFVPDKPDFTRTHLPIDEPRLHKTVSFNDDEEPIVPGDLGASIKKGLNWILMWSALPEIEKEKLKNALILASQNNVGETQTIIDEVIETFKNNPKYFKQKFQLERTRNGLQFPGYK
jgi:hypothetical protein